MIMMNSESGGNFDEPSDKGDGSGTPLGLREGMVTDQLQMLAAQVHDRDQEIVKLAGRIQALLPLEETVKQLEFRASSAERALASVSSMQNATADEATAKAEEWRSQVEAFDRGVDAAREGMGIGSCPYMTGVRRERWKNGHDVVEGRHARTKADAKVAACKDTLMAIREVADDAKSTPSIRRIKELLIELEGKLA